MKLTAKAFGVIDKSGELWPAASATETGLIAVVAELFGMDDQNLKQFFKSSGRRIVPVTITAEIE